MSQSSASKSAIESATRLQTWLFWAYVFILLLGAAFTVFLFRAGNKVQDVIKADADARIAEAGRDAAGATKSASEAKERAGNIEKDNLVLRGQVATLEKGAADAKAKQAEAEHALLQLQQRLAWRSITPAQEKQFTAELSSFRGTPVSFMLLGDAEAQPFGKQVLSVLATAKWSITQNFSAVSVPPQYGIVVRHPPGHAAASAFVRLMKSANMLVSEEIGSSFEITVGIKPPA